MNRLIVRVVSAAALFVCAGAGSVRGQDLLVPAGTLLQCTLSEPNFSSATASVGDPVLCHLKSFQEFGRTVFPRGSMLAGHLEASKEPGHFVGKGYLKITFDRVIVPSGDVPLPAKVIAAKGFKVDKEGDIKGKGHATRDTVEWMIPPLWPIKLLLLPARGPRPALKGEEPLQLRLMDDIVVPRNVTAQVHDDRPPYASSTLVKPAAMNGASAVANPNPVLQTAVPAPASAPASASTIVPVSEPVAQIPGASLTAVDAMPPAPVESVAVTAPVAVAMNAPISTPATGSTSSIAQTVANPTNSRLTMLVLKSNQVLEVSKYRLDGDRVTYREVNGTEAAIGMNQVDWRKTTELTSKVRSVDIAAVKPLPADISPAQVH